jgi:hypothetical protein
MWWGATLPSGVARLLPKKMGSIIRKHTTVVERFPQLVDYSVDRIIRCIVYRFVPIYRILTSALEAAIQSDSIHSKGWRISHRLWLLLLRVCYMLVFHGKRGSSDIGM